MWQELRSHKGDRSQESAKNEEKTVNLLKRAMLEYVRDIGTSQNDT